MSGATRDYRPRRLAVWRDGFRLTLAASAFWALASGCRCTSKAPPSSQRDAGRPEPACRRDGPSLTLAASGRNPRDAGDLGAELPFSVEPGVAVAAGGAFFASALRHESRGATALLGRVGGAGTAGEVVELGRLQGDVVAPRLAAVGDELVVAIAEPAASGQDLRVGRIQISAFGSPSSWVGPIQRKSYESSGFELAAHAGAALIVWDEWDSAARHAKIRATSLPRAASAIAELSSRVLSAAGVDATAPRLSPRPGGYWVSWIASADGAPDFADLRGRAAGKADAGQGVEITSERARVIELVLLDAAGEPSGEVRRVASPAPIVGHDLATGKDGAAQIVWRQGAFTAGASGGELMLAKVGLDGAEQVVPLRADDVGPGLPSFLASELARAPWLSFADREDATWLLPLGEQDRKLEPVRLEGPLSGASAMAAFERSLLLVAPRGKAVELFLASCRSGARSPAP